jgi:polyisoprenoid-binding protein YceI
MPRSRALSEIHAGTTAGFSAAGKLNRKDFGLGWNQLLETGGVVVGDEVKISIDSQVVAKSA